MSLITRPPLAPPERGRTGYDHNHEKIVPPLPGEVRWGPAVTRTLLLQKFFNSNSTQFNPGLKTMATAREQLLLSQFPPLTVEVQGLNNSFIGHKGLFFRYTWTLTIFNRDNFRPIMAMCLADKNIQLVLSLLPA